MTYLSVPDYLAAHALEEGEYVLESEVELEISREEGVEISRRRHPSARLASVDRRSS